MVVMSLLKQHRTTLGLSLEQAAVELELSPSSASWLSEIENGRRDASLRLALRIERWSGGRVTAGSVCKELADHGAVSDVDSGTLDAPVDHGAEKTNANISRTAVSA